MTTQIYEQNDLSVEVFPDGQYRFIKSITDKDGDPTKVVLAFDTRNFQARVLDTTFRWEALDTDLETLLGDRSEWGRDKVIDFEKAADLYNEAVELLEREGITIPLELTGCPEALVRLHDIIMERDPDETWLQKLPSESYVAIISDESQYGAYKTMIAIAQKKDFYVSEDVDVVSPFINIHAFQYDPETRKFNHREGEHTRSWILKYGKPVPITEEEVETFRKNLPIEMEEWREKPYFTATELNVISYLEQQPDPIEEMISRVTDFARCARKEYVEPCNDCRGYGEALSFLIDNKELLQEDVIFAMKSDYNRGPGSCPKYEFELWNKIERNSTECMGRGKYRVIKKEE